MNILKQWNDKTIRFRESDQYGSLTDMAKATGKKVAHWLENKSTHEYLESLSSVIGIPTDQLVDSIQGGIPDEQGTWAERKVCLRFAQWCDSDLAVQVDIWMEELLINGSVSIRPLSPTQALIQALQLWEQIQEEQQRQAVELAVTKALAEQTNQLALSTDIRVNALELELQTLKSILNQPIPACRQTARQRIVEIAQLTAEYLYNKGQFASIQLAIQNVWSRINIKIRNSSLKMDLAARKSNLKKQYKTAVNDWVNAGKPKGHRPSKKNYPDTIPALIESLAIEQPALECTVSVANELVG